MPHPCSCPLSLQRILRSSAPSALSGRTSSATSPYSAELVPVTHVLVVPPVLDRRLQRYYAVQDLHCLPGALVPYRVADRAEVLEARVDVPISANTTPSLSWLNELLVISPPGTCFPSLPLFQERSAGRASWCGSTRRACGRAFGRDVDRHELLAVVDLELHADP